MYHLYYGQPCIFTPLSLATLQIQGQHVIFTLEACLKHSKSALASAPFYFAAY